MAVTEESNVIVTSYRVTKEYNGWHRTQQCDLTKVSGVELFCFSQLRMWPIFGVC